MQMYSSSPTSIPLYPLLPVLNKFPGREKVNESIDAPLRATPAQGQKGRMQEGRGSVGIKPDDFLSKRLPLPTPPYPLHTPFPLHPVPNKPCGFCGR